MCAVIPTITEWGAQFFAAKVKTEAKFTRLIEYTRKDNYWWGFLGDRSACWDAGAAHRGAGSP